MTSELLINGLRVDSANLGRGLYEIICEAGEDHIVAFGMIPKWVIDLFEKQLRAKIIELAAASVKCSVEDVTPYLDEKLIEQTMRPIVREVCTAIYAAASDAGKMVC